MRPPVQLSAVPTVFSISQSSSLISLLVTFASKSTLNKFTIYRFSIYRFSIYRLSIYYLNVTFENAGASIGQKSLSRYL